MGLHQAAASTTLILVGSGVAFLVCLFAFSAVLLTIVLIRGSKRRKGVVDLERQEEPVSDQPPPPLS